MAQFTYSAGNGWRFDCEADGSPAPDGGLVLRAVTHDGHNFAKSMRVVGLWIEFLESAADGTVLRRWKEFHALGAPSFQASAVQVLSPRPAPPSWWPGDLFELKESAAALQFADHLRQGGGIHSFGVMARFDGAHLFAAHANCEHEGAWVEQIFLFSRYSNSPPHEPSSGLQAARCFPLLRYGLLANPRFEAGRPSIRIAGIRFDYRLHLYLDAHYSTLTPAGPPDAANQAGVFADGDSMLGSALRSVRSLAQTANAWGLQARYWRIPRMPPAGTAYSAGAFIAAEKPLVLEVTSPGLGGGMPAFDAAAANGSPARVRAWDNVHWWGARGPGQPLVSTPGAFHCAHLHWRWGAAAKAMPATFSSTFDPESYPRGMTLPKDVRSMWGPLVDPAIFVQNIRLAVVKNHARLDPDRGAAAADMSTDEWARAFEQGAPEDIGDGADLVLWFSVEVVHVLDAPGDGSSPYGDYKPEAGGSVFIHGVFFAHDAEQRGLLVGTTAPIHIPLPRHTIQTRREWFRPAQWL